MESEVGADAQNVEILESTEYMADSIHLGSHAMVDRAVLLTDDCRAGRSMLVIVP